MASPYPCSILSWGVRCLGLIPSCAYIFLTPHPTNPEKYLWKPTWLGPVRLILLGMWFYRWGLHPSSGQSWHCLLLFLIPITPCCNFLFKSENGIDLPAEYFPLLSNPKSMFSTLLTGMPHYMLQRFPKTWLSCLNQANMPCAQSQLTSGKYGLRIAEYSGSLGFPKSRTWSP